jgi:transcriptional regulator with XRE-family HTH domain
VNDLTLRQLRKRQKLTLQQVADQLGTTATQVRRLETGERRMTREWAERMAPIYQRDPVELLFPTKVPTVPITGYVGSGAEVFFFDAIMAGGGLSEASQTPYGPREIECPRHLDPSSTVAVQIRGDVLLPIDDGWLLFYAQPEGAVPEDITGKTCVLRLGGNDGRVLVKRVRRGLSKGRFNLVSNNAELIEDALLDWAAPVRAILPPDSDSTVAAA